MQYRQGSVLEALRRAQGFLDAHAELFGAVNKSGARRDLDTAASALAALSVRQDASSRGSRGETAKQRRLRENLRKTYMWPIATIARQKLRDVPEFKALGLPRQTDTATRLVAKAGGMADAAAQYAQLFIDSGLESDFVDNLRAAADAVSKSIDGRAAHRRAVAGSTSGLKGEEKRGRDVLRVLDSIVKPKLGGDENLLGEWRSAWRVTRKTFVSSTKPSSDPAAPPAGTPTPTLAKDAVKEPAKEVKTAA